MPFLVSSLRISRTCLLPLCVAACGSSSETSSDGAVPDVPTLPEEQDQCTTSVVAGAGDPWTTMALIDDTTDPVRPVVHKGADVVTGIYYASADQGYLVSQNDGLLNARGGAVFKASAGAVTSIAFSGDETGVRHAGSINFVGLERSPTGVIAMAYATEMIASSDGGATFTLQSNAANGRFGIDRVLAFRVTASGTTIVHDNGVISTASAAPGPDTTYVDVWKSSSSNAMCPDGPQSSTTPTTRSSAYVSPGRTIVAYTAAPSSQPMVCVSRDGGTTFAARVLTVPAVNQTARPTGVMFATTKIGLVWYGAGATPAYLRRTTDGGTTWTEVALPADLASHNLDLPGGYFATDCMHGWLTGYDQTTHAAVLLTTGDAGATWAAVDGVGAAVDAAAGDKLYSVFALDTAHIWLGGARGVVLHN